MRQRNTVCGMVKSNLTMLLVWYNIKKETADWWNVGSPVFDAGRWHGMLEFIVQKKAAYRQYAVSFYLKVLLLFR